MSTESSPPGGAWLLLKPLAHEVGGEPQAIVADSCHARYLSPRGEDLEGLDPARTARVADMIGQAPTTPRAWLQVACYNVGLWEFGPVVEEDSFETAYERAEAATRHWTPPPDEPSAPGGARQQQMFRQAQLVDAWARRYPEAAAGDADDPAADLALAQLLAGELDPDQRHRWLPRALDAPECAFCKRTEQHRLHQGSDTSVPRPSAALEASQRDLLQQVAQGFATSIRAKAELLSIDLSRPQQARVLDAISVDIRKFCDVACPAMVAPLVSRAALRAARAAGVDLCQQSWHTQPSFDDGRARGTFHLEHVVPVAALRQRCLEGASAGEIARVLSGIRLAWILKTENRELDRLGFRVRRDDPDAAYRAAGIQLAACPHL